KLYRWDMATNTLSQTMTLSAGVGEAYTPTIVGPDGTVYAINYSILNAVRRRPSISINDVSVLEGNSGTASAIFTVSLSSSRLDPVTVDFSTADGTATTVDNDYQSNNGTVTFAPGETSKTITVLVNGDSKNEPDETYLVNLTNPTNATIQDGQGQCTIQNDDS